MEAENKPELNDGLPGTSEFLGLPPYKTEEVLLLPEAKTPEAKAPPEWQKYRIRGYIITMAVCIIVLYVVNNLLNIYVPWIPGDFSRFFWNILNNVYNHVEITYLSKTFGECLWAINLFLLCNIMGNFSLLQYRPRWFHYLIQSIVAGLAVLALYVVYHVYPFNFESDTVNREIRIALLVLMGGSGLFLIFGLVQFILNLSSHMLDRKPKKLQMIETSGQITEEKPGENIERKTEVDNTQKPEI